MSHEPEDMAREWRALPASAGEDTVPPVEAEVCPALPPLPEIYFDHSAQRYYRRAAAGNRFICANSSALRRELKSQGYSSKTPAEGGLSECDAMIERIEKENFCDYAGPLAGHKIGLEEIHGQRVLITEEARLIDPQPGPWPHLRTLFETLIGDTQIVYLFGWLKVAIECLRLGFQRPGQILIVAGDVEGGKSFLSWIIQQLLGGASASPWQSLIGGTNFNSECFRCVLQLIDDQAPSTDPRARKNLSAAMKALCMGVDQRFHEKSRPAMTLTPLWRIMMIVNCDVQSLQALPFLNDSLTGKLILLKAGRAVLPVAGDTIEDKRRLREIIGEELPCFVHWLLREWEIPEEYRQSRFAIKSYMDPAVMELMDGVSDEVRLLEMLDAHLFTIPPDPVWKGRALELEEELRKAVPSMAGRLFFSSSQCGTLLAHLAQKHPSRVRKGRLKNGTQQWMIFHADHPPPPADAGG